MADQEIRLRHEQLNKIYKLCSSKFKSFEKSKTQSRDLADIESYIADFETNWENYKIELSVLSSNDIESRSKYQKIGTKHKKHLKELKNDLEWKKSSLSKHDLFGNDYKDDIELDEENPEALRKKGRELLSDGTSRLQRTLQVTNSTVVQGREVADKLDQQTEQLEAVYEDLTEMEQILDRSRRVMKKMMRTMKSDQYLWCLIGLVFFSIIGILAYELVANDNDPIQDSLK